MADTFSARWRGSGRGIPDVVATLNRIQKQLDADKLVTWAGPRVIDAIKERTTSGDDLEDRAFRPYSTKSPKARFYVQTRKAGRVSPVTLTNTGAMMGGLRARKAGAAHVVVLVVGEHSNLAPAHQYGWGLLPQRTWLGMSPSNMRDLNRDTLLYIEQKVLKLRGPGLAVAGFRYSGVRGAGWKVKNPV